MENNNTTLWKFELPSNLNPRIDDVEIKDDKLIFRLDIGIMEFQGYHEQDCCESVYADFDAYKWHIDEVKGKCLREILIKNVDDMGFLLCLKVGNPQYSWSNEMAKVFIPCYNRQNGYYSDMLELVINTPFGVNTRLDISHLVEDDID